jgi:hypothetical protein
MARRSSPFPPDDEASTADALALIAAGFTALAEIAGTNGRHADATGDGRWGALLGADDAATYLGIGTTKLRALAIPTVRIGDRRLWKRADLDAYVAALEEGKP